MQWKNKAIVAFDTETTGLQPHVDDRIIEFAAVEFHVDERLQVTQRVDHSWLIHPDRAIPPKVTEITGIRNSDVEGKPRFSEVAVQIYTLLNDAITVAHNYPFDLSFLLMEFHALGESGPTMPLPLAEIDTYDLSLKTFPDARGHRLEDLARTLHVQMGRAHRATDDAAATGQCLIELLRRGSNLNDDLLALQEWAGAVGRPPKGSPIGVGEQNVLTFLDGPHAGTPIAQQQVHLHWMLKARVKADHGWTWRFPESLRNWITRWLTFRGSFRGLGKARQAPRSAHPQDWTIDPCIADVEGAQPTTPFGRLA